MCTCEGREARTRPSRVWSLRVRAIGCRERTDGPTRGRGLFWYANLENKPRCKEKPIPLKPDAFSHYGLVVVPAAKQLRTAPMVVLLPDCSPPRITSPPLLCGEKTAFSSLCTAVKTILEEASCEELGSQPYLQKIIETMGLAGDLRGPRIYGPASKYMRRMGSHTGLWQDPMQISNALLVLGSAPRRTTGADLAPFRYVEVGVFTSWTCTLVSTYLNRVASGTRGFEGLAVDVKTGNIASGTLDLMNRVNVSFDNRRSFDGRVRGWAAAMDATLRTPYYDACFIDGDHGYSAVKGDYAQLAPHCRTVMFHDIQDSSTMIHDSYAGGVPLFWAHARSHVRRERAVELTMQGSPYWPVFGIGVILPGAQGTAEPDDGVSVRAWPAHRGSGAAALYHVLCDGGPANAPGERLPSAYVARPVLCPQVNETNVENVLTATKRTVPKPLLTYAMGLPWRASSTTGAAA